MVIGPTPPGTGVMAPATSTAAAKSTSPTSRVLPLRAGRDAVDADVDHGGAGLDPVALDEARPADRGDQDIGLPALARQILGCANGRHTDRAVFAQQQLRHRLADDVRAADHDGAQARKVAQPVPQQHQAAERGAGHDALAAGRQQADIGQVKAVDILGRIDGGDDRVLVDLVGQGQLHQDAVHRRIGIELVDQRQQLGLACLAAAGARRSSCRSSRSACPCCGHRPGWPDRRRPARRPGRA